MAGSLPPGFQACLAKGVGLFAAGRFHEAHEVWEDVWRQEAGERRALLQGLILIAAGCLQRERGRTEGARRLLSRALARLEGLPATFEGVEVGALVSEVRQWRDGAAPVRPALPYTPPVGG